MEAITTGVACIAFLAMAALAATRARREPIASRFAALCVVFFAYNAFDLLADVSHEPVWTWLWTAAASMCTPVFFHFVHAFIGQRRLRRPSIIGFYAYFGLLGLACLLAGVAAPLRSFPNGSVWAWLVLAGMAPSVTIGVVRLVRYARRQLPEERARVALVLAAVLVAAGGNATDLFAIADASRIRLGVWALVASALLLAAAAFKTRMLENVSVLLALNAFAMALAVVLGEVALFHWLGTRSALLAVASVLLALGALLSGRFLLGAMNESRARVREQAARGRMSQQLAHDLGNPLRTIQNDAQWLETEIEAKRLPATATKHVERILRSADRIATLGVLYQRLARCEPRLEATQVNEVVTAAMSSVRHDTGVAVATSLATDLPECMADRELVLVAVENLVKNAREALVDGGHIVVSTRLAGDVVEIRVADDGPGMDARTRENVFDDFFTTKASGSGLGLPFVHRVMTGHRGRVRVESTLGKGTVVTLELPIASA